MVGKGIDSFSDVNRKPFMIRFDAI